MNVRARPGSWVGRVAAGVAAAVVAASVGTAGAQTGDPIAFDVDPPSQTTAPGTQVDVTFTVSDIPPCVAGTFVSLDSLDFGVSDPSGLSTIASFSDSETPGTVAAVFSPDMKSLSLLFDSAFPCLDDGTTEVITVVVTLTIPAGVPSGTQLTLTGDARGFADPPSDDYLLQRTATVLVASPPPVVFTLTPPTQTTEPGTTVDVTSTVSDLPPCGSDDLTTLDSLDFELASPSGASTIASFTVSEPPGTVSGNFSPDMKALTLLFDSAFPCLNGMTESITVVVTLNIPAGVPSGTQLSLDGDARGFAAPPSDDYLLQRTATVLVDEEEEPPPPPPTTTDPGDGNGPGNGEPGGAPVGGAPAAITMPSAVAMPAAATAFVATPRFAG
jgi:hypothetical protein